MKKQRRQLIILVVILIVLIAGYFGVRYFNTAQENRQEEEEQNAGEALLDLDENDILKITYSYDGVEYSYELIDGLWWYNGDTSQELMQSALLDIVNTMAHLRVYDVISDVEDVAQYGLDEPARYFSFETASESYTFNIGDYNSVAELYYMGEPDSDTVYTVSSDTVTCMNVNVDNLIIEDEEEADEEDEEDEESDEGTDEEATEESEEESAEETDEESEDEKSEDEESDGEESDADESDAEESEEETETGGNSDADDESDE